MVNTVIRQCLHNCMGDPCVECVRTVDGVTAAGQLPVMPCAKDTKAERNCRCNALMRNTNALLCVTQMHNTNA